MAGTRKTSKGPSGLGQGLRRLFGGVRGRNQANDTASTHQLEKLSRQIMGLGQKTARPNPGSKAGQVGAPYIPAPFSRKPDKDAHARGGSAPSASGGEGLRDTLSRLGGARPGNDHSVPGSGPQPARPSSGLPPSLLKKQASSPPGPSSGNLPPPPIPPESSFDRGVGAAPPGKAPSSAPLGRISPQTVAVPASQYAQQAASGGRKPQASVSDHHVPLSSRIASLFPFLDKIAAFFSLFGRSYTIFREARDIDQKRPRVERDRQELAFLPAVLEVLETPPSPIGRGLVYLIVGVVAFALLWAIFGHIDTVAVAQGQIIPGGRVKVIQPLEAGVVRAIHVRDGDRVKKGQVMVELDPTESEVDMEQVQRALMAARMEHARLDTTWRRLNGENAELPLIEGFDESTWADHNRKMLADLEELRSRLSRLEKEEKRFEAERSAAKSEVSKIERLLPLTRERERAVRRASDRNYGTRTAWLEIREELIEHEQDLQTNRHRVEELTAALAQNIQARKATFDEFRREIATQSLTAKERSEQARLELRSVQTREGRNRLVAPVDGVIQQLAVHTVGGVVRPADPLMVVVPDDSDLEVEAMVLNRDIGFVREGQTVEIKVEAFPFTKYGMLQGSVTSLSADSVRNEQIGLVYPMRAAMERDTILVGDRWVRLSPGMVVTAEIKIGERRLIEYFLSPLLRYQDEALRER